MTHRFTATKDLVVEGRTRLAIECDGDRLHGPESHDADMARQRQPGRARWRTWRPRGGTCYCSRDEVPRPPPGRSARRRESSRCRDGREWER